jgi:predicted permease
MSALRRFLLRLLNVLQPRRAEPNLEREIDAHLTLLEDEFRRRGVTPTEARLAARRRFGSVELAKELHRDARSFVWLDDACRDLQYAVRTLRRTPGLSIVVVLTLALGIGANTAIFTVVNGVILRPLGYPKPEQLIYLTTQFPALKSAEYGLSPLEWLEFRGINRSFADVGAFTTGEVNLTAGDRPRRVRSALVGEHLLDVLGIQPLQGRLFASGETNASGSLPPPIAILSYELWQAAFGGRPIVRQTVEVDGRLHEIIGIMSPAADIMDNRTEIWLPLGLPHRTYRAGDHFVSVIGRLRNDVTSQSAQTELTALLENWDQRVALEDVGVAGHYPTNHPRNVADHNIQIKRLREVILGSAGRSIWILQAAVGFVLLIACANLANLLMARAETRRREFAVRAALGASRGRLLRQTVTEAVLLCVAGGSLGLWLARASLQALIGTYPTSLPRTNGIAIDGRVLFFALGVSTGTGLLFGLIPLVHRRVSGLVTALREGSGGGDVARRHHIRRGLVVAEVALAVMLVTGAGLLVRTAYNLTRVDAGFDRSRLATFSMTLPPATSEPSSRLQIYQRLLDTLRAAPGVQAATAMSALPPNMTHDGRGTFIENYTSPRGVPFEVVDYYQSVMSNYFETMGIPIVAGRGFQPTDVTSSGRVAVVNETLANRIWNGGGNPVGRRLQPCCGDRPWYTVIGVARDVRQRGVDQEPGTEVYTFLEEQASAPPTMNVVLRTTLPPVALSKGVENVVRALDRSVPVVRFRDMDSVFAESIRRPRLLAQLFGAFGGLALLLATIGTYGVLSYMVTERRREIGIRLALGADRFKVLAQVMKQGLTLTAIGVLVGITGALGLKSVIASLLFGIQPTDAMTVAAVIATITMVAALACWLPAWRASRVDPSVVLRDG